ncbi:hypothetical protein [Bdellovibrio sp. HCB337]|uniref:hypothetical protein n=1 Tax=Bdellovibrio sp. HCB337 TaxID=3394358 RepID=UPI0039A63875
MAIVLHENKQKEEEKLFSDTGIEHTDLGKPDTLRYKVLTMVLDERYDSAIQELKEFMDSPSEYPDFKSRVSRFVNHSVDLIYAIKAKRSFPGISSLTRAKQQELREKFKEHLQELQYSIKKIEKNQTDLRVTDARSTIYVVRATWYSIVAVSILGFFLEVTGGLALTSVIVVDDLFTRVSDWLLRFANL